MGRCVQEVIVSKVQDKATQVQNDHDNTKYILHR